jgi:putative hydrolase of the HAD superfamily
VDFRRCHAGLAKVCRYPAQEVPRRIGATGLVQQFEKGEISPEDFVRHVSRVLDMELTVPQFWDLWSSIFLPETLLPESLLEGLHRRQRLLLLSNTNAIHFSLARERYPLLRHFDGYVLSYEVGALKPQPEIYREAVARAGCRAEECFFTDDVPAYVDAACREGMDAVPFRSLEQLQTDLVSRGVSW